MRAPLVAIVSVAILLAGCSADGTDEAAGHEETRDILADGCPTTGQAWASRIESAETAMTGPRAVGGAGDYLLVNDRAAFVVTAPVSEDAPQRTYHSYGGIIADAVAVADCEQAGPEQLDEIGLSLGRLQLPDFEDSTLRQFRADTVEVVDDGADGGAAVVRATGTDDVHPLIEYELIKRAAEAGRIKEPSDPLGVEMVVDYTLEPDDTVVQIDVRLRATQPGPGPLIGLSLNTWGDDLQVDTYDSDRVEVGGLEIQLGVPWQVAHSAVGSYAFAFTDTTMGQAQVQGVDATLSVDQALSGSLTLDEPGDEAEMQFLLSVGPTDANSAASGLAAHDPRPLGEAVTQEPIDGRVVDAESGEPVADAPLDLEARRADGEWEVLDRLWTGANGTFAGMFTDLGGAVDGYRLVGRQPGRADAPPVPVAPGSTTDLAVELPPAGRLEYRVRDREGSVVPARISLYQDGESVEELHTDGEGEAPLPPGSYDVVVSRGYEYDLWRDTVEVPDDGSATIDAELDRVVDTEGYVSLDTHVHAAPSPDSTVSAELRALTAAAAGLEVVISTEHEIVEGLAPGVEAAGVEEWMTTFAGQEVTASTPEHTTMYPVEPDGSARGGNVPWYGLDLGEIYAAERARGAGIVGLNHPWEDSYLDLVDWDRIAGEPRLDDPTVIGLPADAELWSWDLDQIEYQNGLQATLGEPGADRGITPFDEWQGFLNHGHRVTAVGATDSHGEDGMGEPRTYVVSPTDTPADLSGDDLVSAVENGQAVVSSGAFIEIDVDGDPALGETVAADDGSVELDIRVQAMPEVDVTRVEVYANCDLVDRVEAADPHGAEKFDGTVRIDLDADANLTVLAFGDDPMPEVFGDYDPATLPRATTNPVFVDVDGNGEFDPPGGKNCEYDVRDHGPAASARSREGSPTIDR